MVEIGLRLGILERETLKISENHHITIGFGDEKIVPVFADKPIEVAAIQVN